NGQPSATTSQVPAPPATTAATPTPTPATPAPGADNTPPRKVKVVTPLYEVTFDTRGAVATSWIIKTNKNTGKPVYAAASTRNDHKLLELIPSAPPEVKPEQILHPFQVLTDDATADSLLANHNFRVSGPVSDAGDATVNVTGGSQQLTFAVHDDATGLDA